MGLSHELCDEDVIQIVVKTLVQQKHSKDYNARVNAANAAVLKERKRLRKIKNW